MDVIEVEPSEEAVVFDSVHPSQRFIDDFGLSDYDADLLTADRDTADYFERTARAANAEYKLSANWILGELSAHLNAGDRAISASPVAAESLGAMLNRITDGTISGKLAKEVFEAMWAGEGDADAIIEQRGLQQITDGGAIEQVVDEIVAANPQQAAQFRAGKEKILGFFVGQVMKATQGKANPAQVNEILRRRLKDSGS